MTLEQYQQKKEILNGLETSVKKMLIDSVLSSDWQNASSASNRLNLIRKAKSEVDIEMMETLEDIENESVSE